MTLRGDRCYPLLCTEAAASWLSRNQNRRRVKPAARQSQGVVAPVADPPHNWR